MGRAGPWRAAGVLGTLVAVVFSPGPAAADTAPAVHVLDVPYVPQGEALCGGAAVAMVMRSFGAPGVRAEDFAAQLEPGGAGIRTDSLVAAIRARGWTAYPLAGTAADVSAHLAHGRPVIALIEVHPGRFHYVVLLAWANGGVILHDPALAPFRTWTEAAFEKAWSGGGRWALLVLPPAGAAAPIAAGSPDSAQAVVPDTAAAPSTSLRGLAAQRFAADDWAAATRLAEAALALDPGDADLWRLLAGSRFLLGDEVGALQAWNRIAEPRADLAQVDGLDKIRYRAVAGQLDLPPGRLLTARAFLTARRRLDEIPAQARTRLRLRPLPGGVARVDAALLERPLLFDGPLDAGAAGVRALVEHEAALRVASPSGNGELWTLAAGWEHERPRASLALAIPAPAGHPGIWRVAGTWERQGYRIDGGSGADVRREERRRSALSFSDWIAPDLRVEIGTALDRWSDRGSHVALEAGLEARWAGDRLALGVSGAQWASLGSGVPFHSGGAHATWNGMRGWRLHAGVTGASATAPLALWPGAGTGRGREPLLRAHPLLEGGVVSGRAFGRTLVVTGVERQGPLGTIHSVRVGWALFVDGARATHPLRAGPTPWQVDAGAGLRIAAPGARGEVVLAAARGLEDGATALSIGWTRR